MLDTASTTPDAASTWLNLPSTVTIGAVETAISDWSATHDWHTPLCIDLQDARWIDVSALLHIIAVTADRHRTSQLITRLRIPQDKRLRDFLRVWQFPQAFTTATGLRFHEVVPSEDLTYFGEVQDTYDLHGRPITTLGRDVHVLESTRFFGFQCYNVTSDRSKDVMIQQACSHWSNSLVLSVLSRHLFGRSLDVSRVTIYESLLNAAQHANATRVCLVSKLDQPNAGQASGSQGSTQGSLTISVWDDGLSIIDTLRTRLNDGLPIRAPVRPVSLLLTKFMLQEVPDATVSATLSAEFTPSATCTNPQLLLSSLFPGITRKAAANQGQESHSTESIRLTQSRTGGDPGMGLYALIQAAIKSFRGSVAIRSSRYFMNVRSPTSNEQSKLGIDYVAKITTLPDHLPAFCGNMLTIRLPLRGIRRAREVSSS